MRVLGHLERHLLMGWNTTAIVTAHVAGEVTIAGCIDTHPCCMLILVHVAVSERVMQDVAIDGADLWAE